MDIFKDLEQAVRFAYALEQYKDSGSLVLVRHALNEAGVKGEIGPHDLLPDRLAELRAHAKQLLAAIHGQLLRAEAASLTATFSRDWDERRAAVAVLAPYFRHLLARIVDNQKLVDKLVARHYIAVRDRGVGWDLDSLSAEFKIPKSRLTRATHALDHCARQLEMMALGTLREVAGPQQVRSQPKNKEPAHA